MARALITGITGQDGRHLAEFLHTKGYEVFGLVKGQNNPKAESIRDEFPFVQLVPGDLADFSSLVSALEMSQPDEVYNLGAISFVAMSFNPATLRVLVSCECLKQFAWLVVRERIRFVSTKPHRQKCLAKFVKLRKQK